jgi:hypothetical protein
MTDVGHAGQYQNHTGGKAKDRDEEDLTQHPPPSVWIALASLGVMLLQLFSYLFIAWSFYGVLSPWLFGH